MNSEVNIRNIGILAHVDAGKTTVAEYILYKSGTIRNLGSVDIYCGRRNTCGYIP